MRSVCFPNHEVLGWIQGGSGGDQAADGGRVEFNYYDTICRQVANRLPNIKAFASSHDWVYFVAGRKSSNGKMLFEECRKANPNTLFISEVSEITDLCPRRAPGRGLRRYIHSQVVDGGSGGPDQGTECFGMIF